MINNYKLLMRFWRVNEMIELVSGKLKPQFGDESSFSARIRAGSRLKRFPSFVLISLNCLRLLHKMSKRSLAGIKRQFLNFCRTRIFLSPCWEERHWKFRTIWERQFLQSRHCSWLNPSIDGGRLPTVDPSLFLTRTETLQSQPNRLTAWSTHFPASQCLLG